MFAPLFCKVGSPQSVVDFFTAPAVTLVPEIADVIGSLNFQPDTICSRMSGSGATSFGLFESLGKAQIAADSIAKKHPNWWIVATTLL